jgi:epoxyqueuosine reductase
MHDSIYGCDRCAEVCPWNRFARPTEEADFAPTEDLQQMTADDWRNLTVERYRQLFKGSAVKRAKYEGLLRNIHALNEEMSS